MMKEEEGGRGDGEREGEVVEMEEGGRGDGGRGKGMVEGERGDGEGGKGTEGEWRGVHHCGKAVTLVPLWTGQGQSKLTVSNLQKAFLLRIRNFYPLCLLT